ncbi:hypothetical protein [Tersicoccus sp. Bi-70]|uniref:hypothetical protein n=1 Tax=Tersicoccus sp. Bi-70 TaxID=1897634 RepID=UPI000977F2E5|nr:hypothetical protein [Tersicoccus sp. Bi-70]OMH30632.1 hypothetical protein BGP79_11780 [Tersicoccus sp. Bi-70]
MSTIRELQQLAYEQSAAKGFHDDEPTDPREVAWLNGQRIALIHSELSEALEELRSGHAPSEIYYPKPCLPDSLVAEVGVARAEELMERNSAGKPRKPEGVPAEMADVVIRVMDFCGANGIDLEAAITEKLEYNATRSHKHGGRAF